jgi:multidrug efflux pump subunit AcrA (membrane-fusion protein)
MLSNRENKNKEELQKKPRGRLTKRLVILVLIAAAVFGLWRLFTPDQVISVYHVRKVSEQDIADTLSLSGTVTPSKTQLIEYKNIPVLRFIVQPGDHVKEGDRLLLYDLAPLRSDLAELKDSREEAGIAIEKSQSEAAELMEGINAGLSGDLLTSQLQAMTGDLTAGLSQMANGMLSIGDPFQQLVDQLGDIDFNELSRLAALLEDLNATGEKLLEVLSDPDLQENLREALEKLDQRLDELQEALNEIAGRWPDLPDDPVFTLPQGTIAPSSEETTVTGDLGVQDNYGLTAIPMAAGLSAARPSPLVKLESAASSAELPAYFLSNSSLSLSQEELLILMQQLQSVPGGSDLLDTYQQGADLLGMLDKQITDLEQKIETASQHEQAEFDALVAEAQRDENNINANKSLMVLYDEKEPLVHARVNRRDALLLEQGQLVKYTTDDLELSGELVFKSPIATTTPVNSDGQSSDLMSQFVSGDQTSLLAGEAKVDIELTIAGADLNKVIFGFDIAFEIETGKKEKVMAVPSESLLSERGQNYIYVLNADDSFSLRPIETGIITRAYAEVLSGLDGDEWVLMNPPSSLQEGVRYNVERQGE